MILAAKGCPETLQSQGQRYRTGHERRHGRCTYRKAVHHSLYYSPVLQLRIDDTSLELTENT